MQFRCNIARQPSGDWKASHRGPEVGEVQATGRTKEQALDKLRGEIRYRLELCPCTGESYQHIDLEIVESSA